MESSTFCSDADRSFFSWPFLAARSATSVSEERSRSANLACAAWKSCSVVFWFSVTFSTVEIWLRKFSVSLVKNSCAVVSRLRFWNLASATWPTRIRIRVTWAV